MEIDNILFQLSVWTLPVIIAVTLHEAAHGWVASCLGDNTAKILGRVTFNPIKHIDLFGTIILPVFLIFISGGRMMFGFAKPVPINFSNLKSPRRDTILVAIAGPGANLVLAFISAALFYLVPLLSGDLESWVINNLRNSLWLNLILFVFNMLPVPPLDGGRILIEILPKTLARIFERLEPAGFIIILGVIFVIPMICSYLGIQINIFWFLIGAPASELQTWIINLVGLV